MKPESSSTIAPATLHSVALVEDDAGTRRLLVEVVNQIPGFRCIAHFDCAETAIEKLPGKSPAIVLMDIKLPGASGIDCVRQLKPRMPTTHFLMLTTYEEANEIFEALAAGAVGYLLKREAPKKLVAALHEVLDGGSPMSSIVARKVVQSFGQPRGVAPEVAQLSERERQVLELLARGQFYKEIADSLGIAKNTVHSYIRRIYEKLHVRSRMEAVAKLGGR
jgi:DNA-binding NarL/FixJ family response regulator